MNILACSEKPTAPQHILRNAFRKVSAAQSKRLEPLRKSIREIAANDLDILIDAAKNISEKIKEEERTEIEKK